MATWKGGPKPPPRVVAPSKLWHVLKHKNLDILKIDMQLEEDQNYVTASERFLELQTQLGMVLHHTTLFRKTLEESLQQAVELADDFGRISAGQGAGRASEPWAHAAGGQAFFLKGMLEESVASLRQHLCDDLEEKMTRSLREEVANFNVVHAQMLERSNMKMEMIHYSNKVQELKGSQKATDEKKDRNKDKYAQASQALRDQTNQLMSTFAHAEQLRFKLLTRDLSSVIVAEKNAFDSFAINLNKAAAEAGDVEPRPPRLSDAARIPHREMPSSDFSTMPPGEALAEVSLDDGSPKTGPPSYSSPCPVQVEPPPAGEVTQTIVKKRQSPMPISPKEVSGAPWSGSNGGGEFGEELKRAHEHQTSKMAAESAAGAAATNSATSANTADSAPSPVPLASPVPNQAEGGDSGGAAGGAATAPTAAAVESLDPPTSEGEPERDAPVEDDGTVAPAAAEKAADDAKASPPPPFSEEETPEEMGELEPGKVRVRALYDYDATQDGDLSFHAGDMIITDGGAFSGDGWVSGDCRGNTGIFPANYTEPW